MTRSCSLMVHSDAACHLQKLLRADIKEIEKKIPEWSIASEISGKSFDKLSEEIYQSLYAENSTWSQGSG